MPKTIAQRVRSMQNRLQRPETREQNTIALHFPTESIDKLCRRLGLEPEVNSCKDLVDHIVKELIPA